jgi:hypothetical protein
MGIATLVFCTSAWFTATPAMAQQRAKPKPQPDAVPLQNPSEETGGRNAESRKPDAESQALKAERKDATSEARDAAKEAAAQPHGEHHPPRLGLTFAGPSADEASRTEQPGFVISAVADDSLAAEAGFQQDDRILQVDGRRFRNPRQLQAYLANLGGRRVPFIVDRDGERRTIQVKLPEIQGGAWLGVYLQEATGDQEGAVVTNVYPASPAAAAGLRPGDVITQLNDQKIAAAEELVTAVDAMQPDAKATFTVLRNDESLHLTAQLGNRPNMFYRGQNSADDGREFPAAPGFSGRFGAGNAFDDIPPFAMQLEHDRRSAEQRQRIETKLDALQKEVQELRKLLEAKK